MIGNQYPLISKLKKNNYRKEYIYMSGCDENMATISNVTFHASKQNNLTLSFAISPGKNVTSRPCDSPRRGIFF